MRNQNEIEQSGVTNGETLSNQSREKILKDIPALLPQEETTVVIYKDCPHDALYFGKWGERHFIGIRSEITNTGSIEVPKNAERRLTHELIHQRFSEIIGMERIIPDYVDLFPDIDFDTFEGKQACKLLNSHFNENPLDTSQELWGISEAVSFLGEKYIYRDDSPLRNRLTEDDYPKPVLDIILKIDESIEFNDIPTFLKRVSEYDFQPIDIFNEKFVNILLEETS